MSIPENCRWLFNQEVQIITLKYISYNIYRRRSMTYSALVLPKSCSLKSMTKCDISKKILFKTEVQPDDNSLGQVFHYLLTAIEERIAEVLQCNEEGVYHIDTSTLLPAEYTEDIPAESPAELSSTSDRGTETDGTEPDVLERRARRRRRKRSRRDSVNPLDTPNPPDTSDPNEPEIQRLTNDSPHPIIAPDQAPSSTAQPPPQSPDYEPSNSEVQFTPSVSAASDTTTTVPVPGPDELAELNRRVIREEINLALRGIFSGLMGPGQ